MIFATIRNRFCKQIRAEKEQKMVQFFNNCPRSWFDFENFCVLAEAAFGFFLFFASCERCLLFLPFGLQFSLHFLHTTLIRILRFFSGLRRVHHRTLLLLSSWCARTPSSSRFLDLFLFSRLSLRSNLSGVRRRESSELSSDYDFILELASSYSFLSHHGSS